MPQKESTADRLPDWLVQNRNFMLLWAAYGISAFGDHLSEMALLKEAGGFDRPNDITRIQALLTFCFFAPFAIFGPLAGWWADRFSRRATMIAADVVRAGVMASLVVTVPWLLGKGLGDYGVALPLLVTGTFAAFFSPSRQALVPTLIRTDQLVRANAMISALGTIGGISSAWFGGALVDWAVAHHTNLHWNYYLDAATYLASAVLIACIFGGRARHARRELAAGVWAPLRAGFAYVRQHRRIRQMILLGTVFWAGAGVVISVVPALVAEIFGGTFSDAGMYRGLIAAGLAIGAAVLTLIGPTLPIPLALLGATLGGGAWVLALDAALIFHLGRIFSGLCLFMIGAHGAGILVNIMVVIQRFVPDARRGRVFGVADMATMAAITAATGLLGLPRIPALDRYIPLLLGAVGAALLSATWWAWREYRRGDPHSAATWLSWRLVRFYAGFWFRAQRSGPCRVPARGPVILAANHTSGVDPLVILGTCPNRLVSFLVDHRYYGAPLAGWFMRLAGCVPINRERPGKSSLEGSLRTLRHGGCLGIFPQGTYVPPDDPQPDAKAGVGLLALRTGATVVPCHIRGTRYTYNPFLALLHRHAVHIRYGRPVDLSDLADRPRDRAAVRTASERIMAAIHALADEEPTS